MEQHTEAAGNVAPGGILGSTNRAALETHLPDYLRARRWFSAKARQITQVRVVGEVPFAASDDAPPQAYITFIEVQYAEGDAQSFVLPLAFAVGAAATRMQERTPHAVVLELDGGGVLYDATLDAGFELALLEAIKESRRSGDGQLEIRAWPTAVFNAVAGGDAAPLTPRVVGAEQSNTSVIYGQHLILKLFRRLEAGISPDLEIGRFLTEKGFTHTPPLAGGLERVEPAREPQTLAILQGFVPNKGDAWGYTLEEVARYFDYAAQQPQAPTPPRGVHPLDLAGQAIPEAMQVALDGYLDEARLLGRRTAEMHLALASGWHDPAFAPVPFDPAYQRGLHEAIGRLSDEAFKLLHGRISALPPATRREAEEAIALQATIPMRFQPLLDRAIDTVRTRVHGDYHLGQVLYTGSDFVIIDFEGEPLRSLEERRQKQSPLKDVAGMLRSFHYAPYATLFNRTVGDGPAAAARLEPWAEAWHQWVSAGFLAEYLQVAQQGAFLPHSPEDLRMLLDTYLLEKAIYELIYELNNRPDWVRIPLQGVRQLAG
jgi:maltose alpha-D-glucosyltransferase/alpha-amylase